MQKKILIELDKEENTNGSSLENRENRDQNELNISLSNPPIPPNPPNSSNSPNPITPNLSNYPSVSNLESNIESMQLIQSCVKLDDIQSMQTRKENEYKNNNFSDEKEKNKDKEKIEELMPNKIVGPKTKSNSKKEKKNKQKNIKIKEEININKNQTIINGKENKNIEIEKNKNNIFDFLSSISQNYNDNNKNFILRKKVPRKLLKLIKIKRTIKDKTRHIKLLKNSDENGPNIHRNLELEEELEFNNLEDNNDGISISNKMDNNISEEGNIRNRNQIIKESEDEMLKKKQKRNNSS